MIKEEIYIFNEPLNKHTTIKIGGPAKIWVEPADINELKEVLRDINNKGLWYRVIGNGSNVLVKDKGVPWVVIKLTNFKELTADGSIIRTGSGVGLGELIKFSTEHNFSGLEFLAGIPGTVGGAIKTNAGAFGKDIAGVLKEVEVIDRYGKIYKIPKDEIEFGYRHSSIKEDNIIFGAIFCLRPGMAEEININVKTILGKRRNKFSVDYPNAGSIFKNPKGLIAGEFIDKLGLKGTSCGKAMISRRHANIIVNLGGAKALDVEKLINYVRDKVYKETGINLELEIECW